MRFSGRFYFLLFILAATSGYAQVFHWEFDSCYSSSKKDLKVFQEITQSGFNCILTSENTMVISIKAIEYWKRFLRKKGNYLVIGKDTLSSNEIRSAILNQFTQSDYYIQIRYFEKYLKKRKKQNSQFSEIVFELYKSNYLQNKDFQISFCSRKGLITKQYWYIHYPELPSDLPELEETFCTRLSRRRNFEHLDENLRFIRYRNYQPRFNITIRKKFKVYFDHNSSEYSQRHIEPIFHLMQDSNLVIRKAKIKAFASVEGDSVNNHRLQQERAEILIDAYRKINEEDIEAEIITEENWSLFNEQLKKSNFHSWDSITQDSIKVLLTIDSIREEIQSLLSTQRYAELELFLGRRLSYREKVNMMLNDFHRVHSRNLAYWLKVEEQGLKNAEENRLTRKYMADMLAIKTYVRKELRTGRMKYEDVKEIFHVCRDEVHFADFYDWRKEIRRGLSMENIPTDSILLHSYRSGLKLENPTILNMSDERYTHSMRVLYTAIRMIKEGYLDKAFIYKLEYPDQPGYAHLNAAKFEFMIQENIPIESNEINIAKEEEKTGPEYDDEWFLSPEVQAYYQIVKTTAGIRIYERNGNSILSIKTRSDYFYEFDLWEFLWFNVTFWKPEENTLLDQDITPDQMESLIYQLKKVKKNLCRNSYQQLLLDYHLKYMKYEDAQNKHSKKGSHSYTFIYNYYMNRIKNTESEVSKNVEDLLLYFNKYAFFNHPYRKYLEYVKENQSNRKEA